MDPQADEEVDRQPASDTSRSPLEYPESGYSPSYVRTLKHQATTPIDDDSDLLFRLQAEFEGVLRIGPVNFRSDSEYSSRCHALVSFLCERALYPFEKRAREFLRHVNWKFRINASYLQEFYGSAAKLAQTFNYHQKTAIQNLFDRDELDLLPALLESFGVQPVIGVELRRSAACASVDDSTCVVQNELNAPSKLRIEVGDRDVRLEILKALFASFLWVSLPKREMHRYFDPKFDSARYCDSFWGEIQRRSPRLFRRDEALHVLFVTASYAESFTCIDDLRDAILGQVRESYETLNNYGFLAVLIEPVVFGRREIAWELAADVVLFGEKHLERSLDRGYFRPARIRAETLAHIPELDPAVARFELVNEGFSYRDCFALTMKGESSPHQLLVMQKNHRDETVVPCPTCRSDEVEGNSYPSLGVKSWECRNALCPDRSKYNRGKRYSFRGLAMQQALDDERNDIELNFVKLWRKDVLEIQGVDEVLEMLVRHYSIWGDGIHCFGDPAGGHQSRLGRVIHWEAMPTNGKGNAVSWFSSAALFHRYGIQKGTREPDLRVRLGDDDLIVFCGDSRTVLGGIPEDSVDGAVTSPPYYNAREYSHWHNIYCYLQDMFEVNSEVFRVLKPGSLYYYNIFDYFDNENTTAFSAMGDKRMVLSAYTVDSFRRIGFICVGTVVWDKGEIEGKRGFNAGNFSPFYQSPFNCWEHVLVFQKPGGHEHQFAGSRILRAKPVLKMVRGKNVHGHSAPFPPEIPMLCIDTLPPNALVLDPFGGSLTTGRIAVRRGRRSICIEQSREYCDLGLRLYSEEHQQIRLDL